MYLEGKDWEHLVKAVTTDCRSPMRPIWNPWIVIQGKMDDERSESDRIGMQVLFYFIQPSIAADFP